MFRTFRFALGVALFAPACGGLTDAPQGGEGSTPSAPVPSPAGAGASGSKSSPNGVGGASAGEAGQAGSDGAGTGGAGMVGAGLGGAGTNGASVPFALKCAPGEGMIVAAGSDKRHVVATFESSWVPSGSREPGGDLEAFVDESRTFGVLLFDKDKTPLVERGKDAATLQTTLVQSWFPRPWLISAPSIKGARFFGTLPNGVGSVARFDVASLDVVEQAVVPANMEWTGLTVDSSGAPAVVGLGAGALCTAQAGAEGPFSAPLCRPSVVPDNLPDYPIPYTRPQIVTLTNGDKVIIFFSEKKLSATTLHEGVWSEPVPVASSASSYAFAATSSSSSGDVVVALTGDGDDSFLRFAPTTGWSGPFPLFNGMNTGFYGIVAAATGVCGDDAVFALMTYDIDPGGPPRVTLSHVRGTVATTENAILGDEFGDEDVWAISIATRGPSGP